MDTHIVYMFSTNTPIEGQILQKLILNGNYALKTAILVCLKFTCWPEISYMIYVYFLPTESITHDL
jgi:hypothetical protein